MICKCGEQMKVTIVESGAVLKCASCGRGEQIPQAKPQDVFDHRARVALVSKKEAAEKKP